MLFTDGNLVGFLLQVKGQSCTCKMDLFVCGTLLSLVVEATPEEGAEAVGALDLPNEVAQPLMLVLRDLEPFIEGLSSFKPACFKQHFRKSQAPPLTDK